MDLQKKYDLAKKAIVKAKDSLAKAQHEAGDIYNLMVEESVSAERGDRFTSRGHPFCGQDFEVTGFARSPSWAQIRTRRVLKDGCLGKESEFSTRDVESWIQEYREEAR